MLYSSSESQRWVNKIDFGPTTQGELETKTNSEGMLSSEEQWPVTLGEKGKALWRLKGAGTGPASPRIVTPKKGRTH